LEFKKLLKNTSFLISTKFVQFFAGIIRSKINALVIGTTGVGIVSQIAFIINRMYQLTTLGMGEAIVKQIAGGADSPEVNKVINKSLKSYLIFSFIFLIVSSFILFLFAESLTNFLFGDIKYKNYYFLAILTIPILILNSIPFSILKSFKDVKTIARARIGVIAVNLILFIPLVLIFKLNGAVVFLPISFVVTLSFNFWYAKKKYFNKYNVTFDSILKTPINKIVSKEILVFSGFGLIIAVYGIFYDFFSRSLVVSSLGVEKIGIYSPIIRWFGLFSGFIMPSFSTYLFPRYSAVQTDGELTGIINDSLRLSTLMLMPLLMLAIPYRNVFIELFYSKDFLEASLYLPFHFFGRVFFIWFSAMVIALKPTGKIKWHALFYIILYTINIIVSYIFIPKYGLYGLVITSIVGVFILFFIVYAYLNKTVNFKIYESNYKLMFYILGTTLFLITVDFYFLKGNYNYYFGPLFLIFTFFLLTTNEKKYLVKRVASLIKIIKR